MRTSIGFRGQGSHGDVRPNQQADRSQEMLINVCYSVYAQCLLCITTSPVLVATCQYLEQSTHYGHVEAYN